jgi:hypothetical protein
VVLLFNEIWRENGGRREKGEGKKDKGKGNGRKGKEIFVPFPSTFTSFFAAFYLIFGVQFMAPFGSKALFLRRC